MLRRKMRCSLCLLVTMLDCGVARSPRHRRGRGGRLFHGGYPNDGRGRSRHGVARLACDRGCASGDVLERRREAQRDATESAGSYPTASMLLAVGLLLCCLGAVQRALPSSSICCGSGSANIREAISLAR